MELMGIFLRAYAYEGAVELVEALRVERDVRERRVERDVLEVQDHTKRDASVAFAGALCVPPKGQRRTKDPALPLPKQRACTHETSIPLPLPPSRGALPRVRTPLASDQPNLH